MFREKESRPVKYQFTERQESEFAHLISRQQYITALRRSSSGGNLYEQ